MVSLLNLPNDHEAHLLPFIFVFQGYLFFQRASGTREDELQPTRLCDISYIVAFFSVFFRHLLTTIDKLLPAQLSKNCPVARQLSLDLGGTLFKTWCFIFGTVWEVLLFFPAHDVNYWDSQSFVQANKVNFFLFMCLLSDDLRSRWIIIFQTGN